MKQSIFNVFAFLSLWCVSLISGMAHAEVTITYYHHDVLGTPIAATNDEGDLVWRKHYTPFGEVAERTGDETASTIGYTGHAVDKTLDLVNMGARLYDPEVGVFLGWDPAAFDATNPYSFNRYAYANNNPYKYVDPDGRHPLVPIAIFIAKEVAGEALEQTTGIPAPTIKNAGKAAAKQLAKNKLQGKAGEQLTRSKLGDQVSGEQVTFKNSKGKNARIDFTKKDDNLVETKTGNAQLSPNQKQLKEDIDNGIPVTPVGKNAANAGFKPGVPVKIEKMEIDRHP